MTRLISVTQRLSGKRCAVTPTSTPIQAKDYIHRLTQGMQAKKYKGGVAAKAKASSNKVFNSYFKPLEDLCQKSSR